METIQGIQDESNDVLTDNNDLKNNYEDLGIALDDQNNK